MKDLKEALMMPKKEGSEKMSDRDIQIKSDILQELMQFAQDQMGKRVKDGMDEMQKVTIAAPDKEGLMAGLDKAQEILPDAEEKADEMEDKSEAMEEMPKSVEDMMKEHSADPETSKEDDEDSYYTKGPKLQYDEDEDSMFNKKMKMKK